MIVSIWEFFLWFFWFYIAISCICIFINVIIDVFRDPSLNGWEKALWTLFLVFFPFLAVFIYLIARGRSMGTRSAAATRQVTADTDQYIRTVANSSSPASEIESAKRLLDSGAITATEYESLKARALSTSR